MSVLTWLYKFIRSEQINGFPTPADAIQSQIITLPPPCFTVGTTHFGLYASPILRCTYTVPGVPNNCKRQEKIHTCSESIFMLYFRTCD